MNADLSQMNHKIWMSIFLAMIVVRMWLTAGDDFTLQTNDTLSYTTIAASYLTTGGPFPHHLPGMPFLSNLVTNFGIPFKLFLDLLLIVTTYSVVRGLSPFLESASTRSLMIKSFLAGAIMFNPWFFCSSRIFMTEALTSILIMAIPVATFRIFTEPPCNWKVRHFFWPTLVTAYTTLVRPEFELMVIFWLSLSATLVGFHVWRKSKFKDQSHHGAAKAVVRLSFLLLPIAISWLGQEALRTIHHIWYGVRAGHATEVEGLTSLLNALYQIQPEQEIRYAPVPIETLRRACEACPTLKEKQDLLLDPHAPNIASAFSNLKLKNEVGTWLNWHLLWVFGGVHKESNELMLRSADEIHRAFEESRLERRSARFPIDPLFDQWSGDIVPLLKKAIRSSLFPPIYRNRTVTEARHVSAKHKGDLENSLLPRKGTVSDPPYFFSACYWIKPGMAKSQFEQINIVNRDGMTIEETDIRHDRNRSFAESKIEADGYLSQDQLFLEFVGKAGAVTVPFTLNEARVWKEIQLNEPDSKSPATMEAWFIVCDESGTRFHSREKAQAAISRNYNLLLLGTISVCFVLGVLGCLNRPTIQHFFVITLVMGMLIFGRCAMYTLLEAWTRWGLERYTGPNHLLTVVFSFFTALLAGSILRILAQKLINARIFAAQAPARS